MILPQSHSYEQVQINPAWLGRARYTAFLNQAFPGQWAARDYDWYVARGFDAQCSDLLVRSDGERVLSGITLCYRQIAVGSGAPVGVAILSAAATLAEERGRGHYSAILEVALERCREKGCVAVLGFVTRSNSSGRGLIRKGAVMLPSFYIVAAESPSTTRALRTARGRFAGLRPSCRSRAPISPLELFARHCKHTTDLSRAPQAHFHYGRAEDWQQQFLQRPHPVRVVRLAYDAYAAVEAVHETDRLQLLVCPESKRTGHIASLAAASCAAGRKFFMYTLDCAEAAAARRARLRIRAGYLLLQSTGIAGDGWTRLAGAPWRVQSGDRM